MYKPFTLEDYGLDLEIGVVPSDDTSQFLSGVNAPKGSISKKDYESYLISALAKDPSKIQAITDSLNPEREKTILRYQILEFIYQLNHRLKPQYIVIAGEKLVHQADALRNSYKTVALQLNTRWLDHVNVESLLNPNPVMLIVDKAWEEVKRKYPDRDYIKQKVELVELEVPVLDLKSIGTAPSDIVREYIAYRCDDDVGIARASLNMWKGHLLTIAIPRIEELVLALNQGGFISVYTDNVVMTQLYLAVIEVNPSMDWSLINWSDYEGGTQRDVSRKNDDDNNNINAKILKGKKVPVIKGIRAKLKSSRDEVASEKQHFNDLSAEIILGLKDKMKVRVVGQTDPIDALVNAIAVARVGLRGDKRPVGCFLLPGPTGVGKTETAKVLADELGVTLVRIDCSEYQHAHEVSKLFGAPPGYVGFEDHGRQGHDAAPPMTLAAKIKANPFSVVLFDELEKADPAIYNVLLQIMDEGHITSGRGETIKFNEAVILMTSNIGTKEASMKCERNAFGFGSIDLDKCKIEVEVINAAIKDKFSPEFLNRLTGILIYQTLTKDTCDTIVDVLLEKTKENLEKAQHMTMRWDGTVRTYVLDLGFSEEYGARNLERTIQQYVELPLAEWILKEKHLQPEVKLAEKIFIDVKDDIVIFEEEGNNNGKAKVDTRDKGIPNTKPATAGRKKGTNSSKAQVDKDPGTE
jgi:hypothetical protein